MSNQFAFAFEELPLVVDLGFEAGLVNGEATISYDDDGEWTVRSISLDGYRRRTAREMNDDAISGNTIYSYEQKPVEIDRASYGWLHDAISERLEAGRFRDAIADRIEKELGEAGVSRPDPNREHSTLNRAQQGA